MRIAVITQDEPFYLPAALHKLCELRAPSIAAMVVLPSFNESRVKTARRLYEFYGAVDFLRVCFWYARAKVYDRLNRIRPLFRPYSATEVARRHSIRVCQPASVNASGFLDVLRHDIRPDLVVSIAASQIFRKSLIAIPPHGCINLHSAPLPKYQGMMPNFWTMYHREPHATVTVHYMVEKLDAGDIILQREVPILGTDSLHDLMVRSKAVGIDAVNEAIAQIEDGTVVPRTMPEEGASYFSFPTREHARRLRSTGRSLL